MNALSDSDWSLKVEQQVGCTAEEVRQHAVIEEAVQVFTVWMRRLNRDEQISDADIEDILADAARSAGVCLCFEDD